ncbi:MAG TPA: glycerol-3-phosphate dehydrogenase [Candidatus Eisenbacteria bacterium]|nr:glycerol-3-phosphate dehydrogenase [Candidatus Eisenbacteria bacterium]
MERYDLVVIGGGIQGAGITRDAALRGLRTILFEKGDLAGGTSSRTSRLVHGGIRYLENLRFGLVKEALAERALLLALAPHLVEPLPFLLPYYKKSPRPRWYLRAGLVLYRALARGHAVGPTRSLSARRALELEPKLPADGLLGAGLYGDAEMDDARLCLENALDAAALGADIRTHHEVIAIERAQGMVRVRARDVLAPDGEAFEVEALAAVNAAGAWADRVRERAGVKRARSVRASRGVHVIVPALTTKHALVLTAQQDRRVFFVIPSPRGSLVGTTEAEYPGNPDECVVTVSDVRYLIEEVRRRWPGVVQFPEHVRHAYAGLRPLVRSRGTLRAASRESRLIAEHGLFTVIGGKYTTYRAVSEHALDRVLKTLGKTAHACSTRERPLPGAGAGGRAQAAQAARERALELKNVGNDDATRLGARYGGLANGALLLAEQFPRVHERAGVRVLEGEVVYSIRHEMARRLDDVILRRLGFGDERLGAKLAAVPVGLWMAEHLGWSRARTQEEVERVESQLDVEDKVIVGALQR